jgi:hypothetical protein
MYRVHRWNVNDGRIGNAAGFDTYDHQDGRRVAILTVKLKEVSGLSDFVNLDEPLYALFYVWLLFSGAGAVSLDRPALLRDWPEGPTIQHAAGRDDDSAEAQSDQGACSKNDLTQMGGN